MLPKVGLHKFLSLIIILAVLLGPLSAAPVTASRLDSAPFAAQPAATAAAATSVTIVGSLQSELGCPGDWQPDCAATHLAYDADDDAWQATFNVPAGNWEYKAALDDAWAASYPAGNIALSLAAGQAVKFYYDDKTHYVADNVNKVIPIAPGSFQSEMGCPGDWQADCLRSLLQDPDGDGIYSFKTKSIPPGNYESKVALNESWDINYGAGGVQNGANIGFTVAPSDNTVTFTYASVTHILTIVPSYELTPSSVTIAGSLQSELGCAGDWDPACAATHIAFDATDDVWQGVFNLPAANYEYKAALYDSWDENYGANAVFNGSNIALNLAAAKDVKFYYDHKSHWVADNHNTVIVVAPGNFQSELGCPGDWQPDCLRSWLQDIDGDGIFTFSTSALPAGSYEGKVALNESWDINYGAGGVLNGANIPFSVAAGQTVVFSYNAATHVPTITVEGGLEPGDELLVRPALSHAFQDQVLYFTIPDRFENGDPSNDCGDYAGVCGGTSEAEVLASGFLPSDRGYYHGGDLAGLSSRLGYLDALGVTSIWVGPIFKNKVVQPDSSNLYGFSSGYHGYWILDFEQVDPHLGSNAEFADLVNQAHALGIQVYMDIITNHTADVIKLPGDAYRNKTTYPYLDSSGTPFDDSPLAYYGQPGYTFPAVNLDSFPYTPSILPGEETLKNPAWLNDPFLYHNRGNSTFTGENSKYGDFVGLDDLWTERQEVVDGMIDIYKFWIETYGVDGFRIDTTKHVNMEFWQKFGPDIVDAAGTAGIADFFAFGEVYTADPTFMSEFSTRGQLQSTIDFGFQQASRDFASQSDPTDVLRDFFLMDDWYTDADSNAYIQPTFVGNHDMGRIGLFLNQDNPGAPDAELLARSSLAQALMYFSRGTPVIYYGDEQGFTGDGGDKLARQDMFPSQVLEYNDDDLIGTDATTADSNFDATHPLFQALSDFSAVRQANEALRSGAQIHRYSSAGAGIYAFSRIGRDEKIEYIVAFNNAGASANASLPTYYGAGVQFDLVYAQGGSVAASLTTGAGGLLDVQAPPLGFVIYKAVQAIPTSPNAPGISITSLANNQALTLPVTERDGHPFVQRIEVAAELSAPIYAEVTFAVKINDGPYTPIGTDNNPPYRVYYDASGLPDGATLAFKAIVDDLSGNLNSTKVEGVSAVIEYPAPVGQSVEYGIVHYYRSDGDYGDPTTGDYNDYWGLHLWGDIDETIEWTAPKPFLGEDEYGRFAWIDLSPNATSVGFILHRGDTKDGTDADRFFNPSVNPEIWLKNDDATIYTSQADAQGFATIHYRRPDGIYTGWGLHLWGDAIAPGVGTDWASPRPYDGVDDFGAYWNVPLGDASQVLNFIIHNGDTKDPNIDLSFIPEDDASVWILSGDETIYPQRGAAQNFITLHYHRPAGDYGDYTSTNYLDYWGMHTWGDAADPGWTTPRKPARMDTFGAVFEVPVNAAPADMGYILHRGDAKDPGPDQHLLTDTWGYEVWQLQAADVDLPYILPILTTGGPNAGNLNEQRAYWISEDLIAWESATDAANTYYLVYAPDGGLAVSDTGITGGSAITLTRSYAGMPLDLQEKFPHLAALPVLKIPSASLPLVPAILKGQIAVSALGPAGGSVDATGLQIPGVLDDLYTYTGELGVIWVAGQPNLRLWAPTAKSVTLHLFDNSNPATAATLLPMTLDPLSGVWSITGDSTWRSKFYLYEVEVFVHATGAVEHNLVTDPYSFSLSTNSRRSQIVDLSDSFLKPGGWDYYTKPPLAAPEDISIYELHVRDFSASDPLVPEPLKGTFAAFALPDSYGIRQLKALALAGLTHLHLLPVFDIATINEDRSTWQAPDPAVLELMPPASDQQQAAVKLTADLDGFNWGYDPLHFTTPEGSYATDPDGALRILEFRQMVKATNQIGLRVVMDVVYNHTNAAGQSPNSVLDRIVPGYYHRLNAAGVVETSTCCSNTASEHNMMEKLMIDSIVTWAKDYKVDGFRFDLMGHHMKRNMLNVRAALDALTLKEDGVDGRSIYLYGEGWNFGEVADNARGVNATQLNMAGTGIGTFNDRARDAVRGIGPFTSGTGLLTNMGFANGLYYDTKPGMDALPDQLARLLLQSDQIRVGLAGNLADFTFVDRYGNLVSGAQVDYNGSPTGYTLDPQEDISYIEAHDNQTFFDINIYAAPQATSMANRVRMQIVGLSTVVFGQGLPFVQAGSELMRSKSLDRNSYNSGDWFNKLDFTMQDNNFAKGLPPNNDGDWPVMIGFLDDPTLVPSPDAIEMSNEMFAELLRIRYSSRLFRLETAADVQARLTFLNTGPSQLPGLVVMALSDAPAPDLDPANELIVVLINANDEAQTFTAPALAGRQLTLHAVQQDSVDPLVKTSSFNPVSGAFTIPGRTAAVFVEFESTSVSLTSSPNPSQLLQPVTLTAQVASPMGTPTGMVQFYDGASLLGSAPLVGGQATLVVSTLNLGNHLLTANYLGDSGFLPSSSPVHVHNVGKVITTLFLSSSADPQNPFFPVTFTATVVASFPQAGVPNGWVAFYQDGVLVGGGQLNAQGKVSIQLTFNKAGLYNMTAVYQGNQIYSGSSGFFLQHIGAGVKLWLPLAPQ